jgi:hypothetical protein
MKDARRPPGRAAVFFGLFVALQTLLALGRGDRWGVLLSFERETGFLVLLLWLKNLLLAAAAGFLAARLLEATAAQDESSAKEEGPSAPFLLLAGGAVLGIGVLLRFAFVDLIPPGVWVDTLYEARRALETPGDLPWLGATPFSPQHPTNELVSNLYLRFCHAVFLVFGKGETGLLAVSALPGAVTPLAVAWLAAEVSGRRAALLALFLAAFGLWPLVFSRWAFIGAALIPLAAAATASALAALRTGRTAWAILSGALAGLMFHTHSSAPAVAAGLAVFGLLAARRRENRRLVAAAAAAALVTFLPFGIAALGTPGPPGGHLRDVHLGAGARDVEVPGRGTSWALSAALLHNARAYTDVLLFTADPNPRHTLPGRAVLPLLPALAALVGLGLASRRLFSPGDPAALLLFVTLGSLLAGVLSDPGGAPNTLRICGAMGPFFAASAAVLVLWGRRLSLLLGVRPLLLGLALASWVAVSDSVPFLRVWPDDPLVKGAFATTETRTGRLLSHLAGAPPLLDPAALRYPFAVDVLAGPKDADVPTRALPRRKPAELLAAPPAASAWYVTTPAGLSLLREGGWRCARGVPPDGDAPGTVVALVRPPRPV